MLAGKNAFEGTVEMVTYIGKDSDYRIRLGPQADVRVRVQNVAAGSWTGIAVGDRVWVSWPEEAAISSRTACIPNTWNIAATGPGRGTTFPLPSQLRTTR
jgi:hypothetical protein